MYEIGTVLELKEKRSTEETPFAYDEVEVLGRSPVTHPGVGGEWEGGDAQGVIIAPRTDFDRTIDEPFGKLQALYTVKTLPDKSIKPVEVERYDATTSAAGPTPEEVFAEASKGKARSKRRNAPNTPLEDPRPTDDGPLGKVEKDATA